MTRPISFLYGDGPPVLVHAVEDTVVRADMRGWAPGDIPQGMRHQRFNAQQDGKDRHTHGNTVISMADECQARVMVEISAQIVGSFPTVARQRVHHNDIWAAALIDDCFVDLEIGAIAFDIFLLKALFLYPRSVNDVRAAQAFFKGIS